MIFYFPLFVSTPIIAMLSLRLGNALNVSNHIGLLIDPNQRSSSPIPTVNHTFSTTIPYCGKTNNILWGFFIFCFLFNLINAILLPLSMQIVSVSDEMDEEDGEVATTRITFSYAILCITIAQSVMVIAANW